MLRNTALPWYAFSPQKRGTFMSDENDTAMERNAHRQLLTAGDQDETHPEDDASQRSMPEDPSDPEISS